MMDSFPVPAHEAERLTALRDCDILDTPPDPQLDAIVGHARKIAAMPIALISLVDRARQWFKAKSGTDLTETPRAIAFCAHAILAREPTIIPDTRIDPRFSTNPLVIDGPRAQFYAGWPLLTHDGHALGTLCVLDHVPRSLTVAQIAALGLLARQAVLTIELRRDSLAITRLRDDLRARAELTQLTVHDLKNPLTVISGNIAIVAEDAQLEPEHRDALRDALDACARMQRLLVDMLDIGRADEGRLVARIERSDLAALVHRIIGRSRSSAVPVAIELADAELWANADADLLGRVIANLVDNASRYAPAGTRVTVRGVPVEDGVEISVADCGPGIADGDKQRVFDKYVQLEPGAHRTSRGLGLVFCRLALDAHAGRIWVEDNTPQGARFRFVVPR